MIPVQTCQKTSGPAPTSISLVLQTALCCIVLGQTEKQKTDFITSFYQLRASFQIRQLEELVYLIIFRLAVYICTDNTGGIAHSMSVNG